jgi:hypothetical protein
MYAIVFQILQTFFSTQQNYYFDHVSRHTLNSFHVNNVLILLISCFAAKMIAVAGLIIALYFVKLYRDSFAGVRSPIKLTKNAK